MSPPDAGDSGQKWRHGSGTTTAKCECGRGSIAPAEQLIETVTIFGRHGFIAPGGPMNIYLGAGLVGVWILGLGVTIARRTVRPAAATA